MGSAIKMTPSVSDPIVIITRMNSFTGLQTDHGTQISTDGQDGVTWKFVYTKG